LNQNVDLQPPLGGGVLRSLSALRNFKTDRCHHVLNLKLFLIIINNDNNCYNGFGVRFGVRKSQRELKIRLKFYGYDLKYSYCFHFNRLPGFQRNRQHDDTDDPSLPPGRRANCQRVDHDSAEAQRVHFFQ